MFELITLSNICVNIVCELETGVTD